MLSCNALTGALSAGFNSMLSAPVYELDRRVCIRIFKLICIVEIS